MSAFHRVAATVFLGLFLGLAATLALAGPAQASCAGPPTDSPYAFTGTVVEVDDSSRVATVVLDDGSEVVVQGGPDLGGSAATSVDRHYTLGGRYEFHPSNDTSPFQDNACSATRQLSGPTPGTAEPNEDQLPGWLPVDEQAGPDGYAAVGAVVAATIALLAVLAVLGARRSRIGRNTRVRVEG